MIVTHITPNIDRSGPIDLPSRPSRVTDGSGVHIAGIPNGTTDGATVVAIVSPLPDGGYLMTEIKLRTLEAACAAIRFQCGDTP